MRIFFFIFLSFLIILTVSCKKSGSENSSNELSHQDLVKLKQYISQGRILYEANCANCHQKNGEGLASLYPPVKNSDFFMKDVNGAICHVKTGLKGEIIVNGKVFNQIMPPNNKITELEIAEIMTFLVNDFNDSTALITPKYVHQLLKDCAP